MIRKVEKEELPECLDVIHKSFATVAEEFGLNEINCPTHTSLMKMEKLNSYWDWGYEMFGYDEKGELVGYFSLSQREKDVYELHNLAVLPEYRHNGYGRSMLDYAKAWVKNRGGHKLIIGIIAESSILKKWYQDNGFSLTGIKEFEHLPFTVAFLECIV